MMRRDLGAYRRKGNGAGSFANDHALSDPQQCMETMMGKGLLLWLIGVPIPVIIVLWLLFGR
jgi:hypothetical protein